MNARPVALFLAGLAAIGLACLLPPAELSAQTQTHGEWQVEIDPMPDLLGVFRAQFRQARAPAIVGLGFEITRKEAGSDTFEARKSLVDGWQEGLAVKLEDKGFVEIDDDELAEAGQPTRAEMREKMLSQSPYGLRDQQRQRFAEQFYMLYNERLTCARANGVVLAYVLGFYPAPEVKSEYGSVAFMLIGVGGCAGSERHLSSIARQLRTEFLEGLE